MASLKDLVPQYLHTDRLTLELFNYSPEHYVCLPRAMNSKTAHETMGDHGVRTPADFDALVSPWRLKGPKFTNGVADGKLVGGISMSQHNVGARMLPPDVGWCTVESDMGHGYATEAAREVIRWATEDFGIEELIVFPDETNQRSNRVAEKLGFVHGGQVPDADFGGHLYNVLVLPSMKPLEFSKGEKLSMEVH